MKVVGPNVFEFCLQLTNGLIVYNILRRAKVAPYQSSLQRNLLLQLLLRLVWIFVFVKILMIGKLFYRIPGQGQLRTRPIFSGFSTSSSWKGSWIQMIFI